MTESRTFVVIIAVSTVVAAIVLTVLRALGSSDEVRIVAGLLCLVAGALPIGFVKPDGDRLGQHHHRRHDR
jgi:hypothetical protein